MGTEYVVDADPGGVAREQGERVLPATDSLAGVAAGEGDRVLPATDRLTRLAACDGGSAALVNRLLRIGLASLPAAYAGGEFAFRVDGTLGQAGALRLTPSGTSARYAAIAALGVLRLPTALQPDVLAGESCRQLVGRLVSQIDLLSSLGDVALTCWAAAEAAHPALPRALARLAALDWPGRPTLVVDAAWTLSALVAARPYADVEEHLIRASRRLLGSRGPATFPHVVPSQREASWRAHVGSFADQVYPVQALARLHRSRSDPVALAVADEVAAAVCAAQGQAGQWWWHYDARTGKVIEGYPVYSVHQHAMAPMALYDLADAGGRLHIDAISRGIGWLANPPETSETLLFDDPPITWRKVARRDRRKLVRGLRAASTRFRPGTRLALLDRVFPPGMVDHECRPYELGWLLYAWLS